MMGKGEPRSRGARGGKYRIDSRRALRLCEASPPAIAATRRRRYKSGVKLPICTEYRFGTFKRDIEAEFRTLLGEYPIVTILGPRQAGKTTLAQMVLPDYAYRNLELPHLREFASRDPRGFLDETGAPAILDEIQRVPELLSYLQAAVDATPRQTGAMS